MSRYIDMTGERWGRLTVLHRSGSHHGSVAWLCRCDCGTERVISGVQIRRKGTRSCGCLIRNPGLRTHKNAALRKKGGGQPRGSRNFQAKLSADAVRAMREEYAAGGVTYQQAGEKYGVCAVTAGLAIRRKTWRHVVVLALLSLLGCASSTPDARRVRVIEPRPAPTVPSVYYDAFRAAAACAEVADARPRDVEWVHATRMVAMDGREVAGVTEGARIIIARAYRDRGDVIGHEVLHYLLPDEGHEGETFRRCDPLRGQWVDAS